MRSTCRLCSSSNLSTFLDLGFSPIADTLTLNAGDVADAYPLRVGVCQSCWLIQLMDDVDSKVLFNGDYAFRTGSSPSAVEHFANYATTLKTRFPTQVVAGVLDIASNDGIFLAHFTSQRLGVDPATTVVKEANDAGIPTIAGFFSSHLAERLNKFGVITANNVLAHCEDVNDFVLGVKNCMAPGGIAVFEVQYARDLIQERQFDHVYHQHRCFFLLHPLKTLFKQHGLDIFDVEQVNAQGGSLRVYVCGKKQRAITDRVDALLAEEDALGLTSLTPYGGFQEAVDSLRDQLRAMVADLKDQGKSIAGYGASAKATTLLNYCGIALDFIADTTPYKFGKFLPGVQTPILAQQTAPVPDYCLLLVWNYLEGVLEREKAFREGGGKFIVPVPEPHIV